MKVMLLLHVVEEAHLVPLLEGDEASAEQAGHLLTNHTWPLDPVEVRGQLMQI